MPKQIAPSWSWTFTINNYDKVAIVAIVALFEKFVGLKYFLRREVGESGTPHIQGSIWQTRRMAPKPGQKVGRRLQFRPLPMFKIEKSVHWERMKCSPQCNIDYCGGTGDHEGKIGFGSAIHNLDPEWYPKSWFALEKALKAQDAELAMKERNDQWLLNYRHLLQEWYDMTDGGRKISCEGCVTCKVCHGEITKYNDGMKHWCEYKMFRVPGCRELMDEIVERIQAFYLRYTNDFTITDYRFDFGKCGSVTLDPWWHQGEPFWYPFDNVWEYVRDCGEYE